MKALQLNEVIPQFQLRWPVIASASLHALIALLLFFNISVRHEVVPVGIEMLYLGEAKVAAPANEPAKAVTVPRTVRAPKAVVDEPAQVKQAEEIIAVPELAAAAVGLAGAKDGAIISAIERYKYELRLFLESRKIYPETARRLRQTGKVVVNFKINATGDLSEINMEQPSGSEILNRAALDLVRGARRFKPFPEDTQLSELKLSLPIEYIL